jgi:hypothetical protein
LGKPARFRRHENDENGVKAMLLALRILLGALGVSAIFVSASMLALGAQETVAAVQGGGAMWHASGPMDAAWLATMDSQVRFYAAFWGAYGVLLVIIVTNTEPHLNLIPWLAAVIFAGGVGRAISRLTVGAPYPSSTGLMVAELLAPLIMILLWWGVRRRRR